jgi:hypothetical protein
MSTEISPAPDKSIAKTGADRRTELRFKFGAAAELVDNISGDQRQGRVRDLSLQGCYVDMDPCFPLGTAAKIRITKDAVVFEAQVRVVFAQSSKGMGLLFTSISPAHIPTIKTWISDSRESSWLAANRRRSQRILLRVPVRVSGAKGAKPPFEEDTNTMAINPDGALILLSARVKRGQSLILSNIRTGSSVECIVAYIGDPEGHAIKIGVAFVMSNSTFWPVAFPPADWTPRHEDAKQHHNPPAKS